MEEDIGKYPVQEEKEIGNLSLKTSKQEITKIENGIVNQEFNPDKFSCLGPQYQTAYLPTSDREVWRDVEDSLSRIHLIFKSQGTAAFVKYKLFNQEIYGLGLVDTRNLVQSTLISKEYFDLLGLKLVVD